MLDDDDDHWRRPPASRAERAQQILARLDLGPTPEHPAALEAEARRRAERLARHDLLFGITPELSNRDLMRRAGYIVGDADGRDD